MDNLNRVIIMCLLLGLLYALYCYQQKSMENIDTTNKVPDRQNRQDIRNIQYTGQQYRQQEHVDRRKISEHDIMQSREAENRLQHTIEEEDDDDDVSLGSLDDVSLGSLISTNVKDNSASDNDSLGFLDNQSSASNLFF